MKRKRQCAPHGHMLGWTGSNSQVLLRRSGQHTTQAPHPHCTMGNSTSCATSHKTRVCTNGTNLHLQLPSAARAYCPTTHPSRVWCPCQGPRDGGHQRCHTGMHLGPPHFGFDLLCHTPHRQQEPGAQLTRWRLTRLPLLQLVAAPAALAARQAGKGSHKPSPTTTPSS
jgi:hypothetical protein